MPGSNGKGLVDLLLYKLQLNKFLLDEWAEALPWPATIRATLRSIMESHCTYRDKVGFPNNAEKPNQQWRLGWPDSVEDFFAAVEAIVFSPEHDGTLKQHLKNRKTVVEAVATSGLSELFDAVSDKAKDIHIKRGHDMSSQTPGLHRCTHAMQYTHIIYIDICVWYC